MAELGAQLIVRSSYHRFKLFLSYFEFGENNECWIWNGGLNGCGYGVFNWPEKHIQLAHCASYVFFMGDRKDLEVCHTCDNPPCVNPSHLWLGTHLDNMRDCKMKGRNTKGMNINKGERNGMAIVTWDIVRKARKLYRTGNYSQAGLGRKLGIPGATMHCIIRGKTWN